jgi:hypothetical protein
LSKSISEISFRPSINWAWKTFKDNPIFYVGIVLTFFASWVLLELFVVAGQKLGTIFNLAIHVAFLVMFSALQIGFIKICLDVYAGKHPPYANLLHSLKRRPKFLIAQLAYLVMVSIGLLLLLIPGFYLGGKFAFFGFDIAENDSTILDSFHASTALTNGSISELAYYLFLLTLLNLFGALWLGLGLLVTVPVSVLTMTSLYQDWKPNN